MRHSTSSECRTRLPGMEASLVASLPAPRPAAATSASMLGIHRAEYAALQAWRVRKFIIAEHDTMSSRHGVNESSRAHMIMNLRHLRYFLVLCQELNFTRAARQCGISQPSLTNAIRTLERELGG